jgi:hypothetical protein
LGCEFEHEPVDLFFSADIDPFGWLIEKVDLRLSREPTAKYYFLLISAAQ